MYNKLGSDVMKNPCMDYNSSSQALSLSKINNLKSTNLYESNSQKALLCLISFFFESTPKTYRIFIEGRILVQDDYNSLRTTSAERTPPG
jgi:hypothetical protein